MMLYGRRVPVALWQDRLGTAVSVYFTLLYVTTGGSVAEWLACWTQAQKGLGSNRSLDAVG